MEGKIFQGDYEKRKEYISQMFRVGENFDMLQREIVFGDRQAVFFMVDGFLKGDLMEKMMEFFYSLQPEDIPDTYEEFVQKCTPYGDIITITTEEDFNKGFRKLRRKLRKP